MSHLRHRRERQGGHVGINSKAGETKLTPAVQAKILKALRDGNTYKTAALVAGISQRSLFDWLALGREGDRRYVALAQAVKEATAVGEAELVASIRTAGQVAWQANAWLLERRNPKDFGRKDRVVQQTIQVNATPDDEKTALDVARFVLAAHGCKS